jgi:MinD superfamily P-loop ATPase
MVHAKLAIGADNSGKLVARVKNEAKRIALEGHKEIVIIDGSPGIGCPVVSSLSGATFVVLVTEPSASGIHDLKRVYELVKKFNIKAGCIINKSDINKVLTSKILAFLREENIVLISNLPYDEDFTRAMVVGQTIVEYENKFLAGIIKDSWNKVKEVIK